MVLGYGGPSKLMQDGIHLERRKKWSLGREGAETSNKVQCVAGCSDWSQIVSGSELSIVIYYLGDPGQFSQSIRASVSSSIESG